jgi:hypothetical protein
MDNAIVQPRHSLGLANYQTTYNAPTLHSIFLSSNCLVSPYAVGDPPSLEAKSRPRLLLCIKVISHNIIPKLFISVNRLESKVGIRIEPNVRVESL